MKVVHCDYEKLKESYENSLFQKLFSSENSETEKQREWYGDMKVEGGKIAEENEKRIIELVRNTKKSF